MLCVEPEENEGRIDALLRALASNSIAIFAGANLDTAIRVAMAEGYSARAIHVAYMDAREVMVKTEYGLSDIVAEEPQISSSEVVDEEEVAE